MALLLGWFPKLYAKDLGLEFYFYIWPGHCSFVYSLFHRMMLCLWGTRQTEVGLGYLILKLFYVPWKTDARKTSFPPMTWGSRA